MPDSEGRRSVAVPAVMLGIGLGGAFDGIVLHQLLQWHHLLTSVEGYPASTVDGLESNTWADGVFQAVAYAVVVAGVIALWSRLRAGAEAGWRSLVGWALVGWGAFNLVEGIVDHHLLGIHHVRAGPDQLFYDLGFLALGAILVVGGWALARSERQRGGRRNAAEGVIAPPGRDLSLDELRDVAIAVADRPDVWRPLVDDVDGGERDYRSVYEDEHLGVWAIVWSEPDHDTGFHDHDRSRGAVCVAEGAIRHELLTADATPIETVVTRGGTFAFDDDIHRMRHAPDGRCVTIHAYSPPLAWMGRYDLGEDDRLLRLERPSDDALEAEMVAPGKPFRAGR